jgi:hypothetical protein
MFPEYYGRWRAVDCRHCHPLVTPDTERVYSPHSAARFAASLNFWTLSPPF